MGKINYKGKSYGGSVGSNPNLLINGDFQVNQRGATTYEIPSSTWNTIYTVDRWALTGQGVKATYSNNKVTVVSNLNDSYLRQIFEKPLKGTYIATVNVTSLTGNASCYMRDNNQASYGEKALSVGINHIEISGSNLKELMIMLSANANITIEYIKLEQGSVATPFIPRMYAEELALCQRYYFSANLAHVHAHRIWRNERGGDFLFDVMTSVPMRTTPTFTLVQCSGMYDNTNNSSLTSSELSISLHTIVNYQYAQLLISKTSGDMSSYDSGDWNVQIIHFTLDAEIYDVTI